MSKFEGVDFYKIDDLLTDEETTVRDTVRAWVDERVLPIIEEHYQNGTFPMELAAEMGEMGFLGSNLDGYGCPGLNNVCYGLICQELERGDSAIRSFCSVQGSLVMFPFMHMARKSKSKVASKLAAGKAIGCFGLTEPDFGSNPSGMILAPSIRAITTFSTVRMWITNGTLADVAVVWAKLDGVVRGFLVEKGMEGFTPQR